MDTATPTPSTPAGLLIIDKPVGWTSMDVCARVRSLVKRGGGPKRSKVGHAGTLDPFATGVLVVLVGKATRLSDIMMAGEKEYLATIDLAHTSTTQDPTGLVEPAAIGREPTATEVANAAAAMTGTIMQRPPAHSAIHVGGQRAYDLARRGIDPKLPARPVIVHAFEVIEFVWPLVRARVVCGKGTYIRSMAVDLGASLGCGGMLRELRRTRVGSHGIKEARTIDSLGDRVVQNDLLPMPAV